VTYYEQVVQAADAIRQRVSAPPAIGIVLGSGLGDFADTIVTPARIPFRELAHWPASTVTGHQGQLVVGHVRGKVVAALSGRCHLYEGYDPPAVAFGVRVLGVLGVKTLILTNAAGGLNSSLTPGTLMIIDDHINLTGQSPLTGPNEARFGTRFPDMSEVYSGRLRDTADEAGKGLGVPLAHGVYAALVGPSYETPAEIRYLQLIGADAVGMSTVLEALAARHMGVEVLGISCITNVASSMALGTVDHTAVLDTAYRTRRSFISLLEGIIDRL
jgi:purine-nucleoside phosphorylase